MDDDELLAIKDRAWQTWSTIPGVHAIGIGDKTVSGVRSGESAIVVFVVKKKSLSDLKAVEIVPPVIEGVKTDVVEMKIPRLLAKPPDISATVIPPSVGPGAAAIITVSSTRHLLPEGWVVVISILATSSGAPPKHIFVSYYTDGTRDLPSVAFSLANRLSNLNLPHFGASSTNDTGIVTVVARPPFNLLVACQTLRLDSARYADEYLRGGIRIQEGRNFEVGTLGCIATTKPTAIDPHGKVIALTNQHVVSSPRLTRTNLVATLDVASAVITMSVDDRRPVAPQSLVAVIFFKQKDTLGVALHVTAPGDTLVDVVAGVIVAINNASIPKVSAFLSKGAVQVNGFSGSDMDCLATGPADASLAALLNARIEKPFSRTCVINFQGRLPNDDYGIFVGVNPGGVSATFGTFLNPVAGTSLKSLAEAVAESINSTTASINKGLDPSLRLKVHAEASGPQVTVTDAQEIECSIRGDVRVGQPTNSFGSPCSHCCSHQIGRVIEARLDVDAAIIQLDPGVKYKPQIEGLGPVDGILAPSRLLPVEKRGFVSGTTAGQIVVVGASGITVSTGFQRFYNNAIFVESSTRDQGGAVVPFILEGDSGSALVSTGGGHRKVIGLLFAGGGSDTMAIASPIDQVISAFPSLGLSFALAPGQNPEAVQVVPVPAIKFQAAIQPGEVSTTRSGIGRAGLEGRLREAESEITSTNLGREYADVFQTHFAEAQRLVNGNRRVGTVWQRSGGPAIMNKMFEVLSSPDQSLPEKIDGKPLSDCLMRIQAVLMRYASPAFYNDLNRYVPQIAEWSGMTYAQLLSALQEPSKG